MELIIHILNYDSNEKNTSYYRYNKRQITKEPVAEVTSLIRNSAIHN